MLLLLAYGMASSILANIEPDIGLSPVSRPAIA